MPTHLPPHRPARRLQMRSGDAEGILATIAVAASLIVCALTWQSQVEARPSGGAGIEQGTRTREL